MLPIQITSKDVLVTPALESNIRKRADKLQQFFKRITSLRVVIMMPKNHLNQGKIYNVHLDATVPGKELVVTKKANEDMYLAIRDAFIALTRQLEDHGRIRHGHVKLHDSLTHGRIQRMVQDEGYGFIEDPEGNEYYFSMTNVSNPSFDLLSIGDLVEFIVVPLSDGLQAHRVTKVTESM